MENKVILIIGIGQAISALALIAIAVVLVLTFREILKTIQDVRRMLQEDVRQQIMPEVTGTLRNVKTISDDAARTTHNVTGTVDSVTNIVKGVTDRLESPLIRAVGLASGLFAGVRALRGGNKEPEVIVVPKKRRGFFG